MESLQVKELVDTECSVPGFTLENYSSDVPRWCKGCGDLSILSSVQRLLRDEQTAPESVVTVSGIGCSSRFPHYINTYGFHGIHGRALPIATGVSLARPDLKVLAIMGDGDCFSIGAGHWVHAIRYNINMTALVFDNEIYGLTKKQVSPTTRVGTHTNTTPRGAFLEPMNPLSVIMGITNVSFLAQTATWFPGHLEKTINLAWQHKGMAFVRVLQRCPIFSQQAFYGPDGRPNLPVHFLKNTDGVPIDKAVEKSGIIVEHDHTNIDAAQRIARGEGGEPMGLIYRNPAVPTYNDIRSSQIKVQPTAERINAINAKIDTFAV